MNMNEEKAKNIALSIFIGLILIGSIFAVVYNVLPSISGLRDNSATIPKSNENINLKKEHNNTINSVEEKALIDEMNLDSSTIDKIDKKANDFSTEVSTYSTTIYDTEENRIYNIRLATEKLNDTVIKKGDEFSFNSTIGPMGPDNGFKKATGFDGHGRKIKIYAGGLCQISSTLYNTALIANLEIIERHAHSARVYYVPKDKDATISYGGADLKFKNNTDNDLKIIATTDGHDVTIKLFK